MARWLVALVCVIGLAGGCDDDDAGNPGTGGTGGSAADAASTGGTGTGGSSATGGTGGSATGGSSATGGTGGSATGGSSATGGTGGSAADAAGDTSSASASMMVTVAAGGTLSAGGGSLLIPAGVLAADQMLTVTVRAPSANEPGRANIVGDIYDFGPDGTKFSVPVQLTLPLPGPVPADKKAVVAWLEDSSGEWFTVATTVTGDKATGLITHFTRFALLVIPKDEMCPYAGACGGSLDGTWNYGQTCLKATESEAFKCGDLGAATMRNEYFVSGTVTITGARFIANQMIKATGTLFYTPACMTYVRQVMPGATCATLQEAWRKQNVQPGQPEHPWICAGTPEQGCSCQLTNGATQTVMGAVAVNGSKVTFTQDGKTPGTGDDFCVRGNNLSVRTSSGEVYTAVKQ
jgi:hypothetical protein